MENLRHQVFVSSTFRDLQDERRKVAEALLQIECIPAGMEMFPAADAQQLEFIKRVIDDCDYYVVIVGGRYGSITEEGLSFTELEYQYARDKGVPVLAFIHSSPEKIVVEKSELDAGLRTKLEAFKAELQGKRLTASWSNADDLVSKVVMSVVKARKTDPRPGWVRGDQTESLEVLRELLAAKRRVEELEATQHTTLELTSQDLSFIKMNLEFKGVGQRRRSSVIAMDKAFEAIGGGLAFPVSVGSVGTLMEEFIVTCTGEEGVDLLPGDATRVQSYFFGKGLIDIMDGDPYPACKISEKGELVLRVLTARANDDVPPF